MRSEIHVDIYRIMYGAIEVIANNYNDSASAEESFKIRSV